MMLVEDFIIESGLRDLCSNVCGGECCAGCPDRGPGGCETTQSRKLSCSIYICLFLGKQFLENYLGKLVEFIDHVIDSMQSLAMQIHGLPNIFYCDLPDLVVKELKIDKEMIDITLSKDHCQKVNAILQELKQEALVNENRRQARRFFCRLV